MATYPDHVTPTARRIAERFYRHVPQLEIPRHCELDDVADLPDDRDSEGSRFRQAAIPERSDDDN